MDEQKLAELFRDATRDAPPASFDVAGVRTASQRATARRRSAIALGSTLAVVLVFGGVVTATGLLSNPTGGDTAAVGSAQGTSSLDVPPGEGDPEVAPLEEPPAGTGGPVPKNLPEVSSTQGDDTSGSPDRTSVGGAQRGCVEVDRELAVALADELPVAEGTEPSLPAADCPVGARGAGFPVRDGDVHGTVSVVIAPSGTIGPAPDRTVQYRTADTPRGDQLYVLSRPDEGASVAPFVDELSGIAERLAARF